MGTSTGYQMPTGGEWRPLKVDATAFVQDPDAEEEGLGQDEQSVTPESLLGRYMQAVRSADRSSAPNGQGGGVPGSDGDGGRDGGTRASAGGGMKSARRVTQSLGDFLSRVGTSGICDALNDIGLGGLAGQSPLQIAAALLDKLTGPASTIDDAAARAACDDLNKELIQGAQTLEDMDRLIKEALDARGLGGVLMRFFSLYMYRRFCRDFYESWSKRVGASKANAKLAAIKKFIDTTLKARCVNKEVTAIRWQGGEGQRLMSQVIGEACRVFGVQT
jgi:hypothetical protein